MITTNTLIWSFLIMMCFIMTNCQTSCPGECECITRDGMVYVTCIRKRLTSIPDTLPVNTKGLNLKFNRIRTLPADAFARYPQLTEISLERNHLKEIHPYAFRGLGRGARLDLKYNNVTILSTHSMSGIDGITSLDLEQNQIDTIEANAFTGSKNIEDMILKGNPLRNIQSDAFKGLSNVRRLDLSRHSLQKIKTGLFAGLTNVTSVYVSYGKNLSEIEEKAFIGMQGVSEISLQRNHIVQIAPRAFETLGSPKSVAINLRGNRVETLQCSTFDRLSGTVTFNFRHNPIKCDCRMSWIMEETDPKHLSTVTCALPLNLSGTKLNTLKPEDLPCDNLEMEDGCPSAEKTENYNVIRINELLDNDENNDAVIINSSVLAIMMSIFTLLAIWSP